MNTREQLIKARLGVLALAQELDNIRLACKRAGISKSQYYDIKAAYQKYSAEGLAPRPRRPPRMPNQTPPELEHWCREVAGWLEAAGDRLPKDVDRARLARFVLTVMEGGLMQARAAGSLEPFDASVAELRTYFQMLEDRAAAARKPGKRAKR